MGVVGGVVVEDVLILGGAGVVAVGGPGVVVIVVVLVIAVQLIAALIVRATKLSCNIIRPLTRDGSLNILILIRHTGHMILEILDRQHTCAPGPALDVADAGHV